MAFNLPTNNLLNTSSDLDITGLLPEAPYAVPIDLYFLLADTDRVSRILLHGVIAGFGLVLNLVSLTMMFKGKFIHM